ncbi:ArsR/SmtB family transcription factor [Agrobacterium sp. P15N1-A]|uniref:ArsR/SmtB family transcription factor n=1 Tax=Agrobacterium sp. P15N1-A TaxID=3342820 RepID=UPI0037D7A0CB
MEQEKAILALAALAQPTRLQAFNLLVQHEPDGIPAGDVARILAVPQNTMSSHLSVLARAGLINAERRSRLVVYRADISALREVMLYLVKDCCGGRAELCAPLVAELSPCCIPQKVSS